jgi:hypothetical protein
VGKNERGKLVTTGPQLSGWLGPLLTPTLSGHKQHWILAHLMQLCSLALAPGWLVCWICHSIHCAESAAAVSQASHDKTAPYFGTVTILSDCPLRTDGAVLSAASSGGRRAMSSDVITTLVHCPEDASSE